VLILETEEVREGERGYQVRRTYRGKTHGQEYRERIKSRSSSFQVVKEELEVVVVDLKAPRYITSVVTVHVDIDIGGARLAFESVGCVAGWRKQMMVAANPYNFVYFKLSILDPMNQNLKIFMSLLL